MQKHDCLVLLLLPIKNLLILREVEQSKTPENNRKGSLLQMGLSNAEIDGVLAQSQPLPLYARRRESLALHAYHCAVLLPAPSDGG